MVEAPQMPAIPEYPKEGGPHKEEIDKAKQAFLAEVDNTNGWEDHGEREDVHIWRKIDPEDPSGVPLVRGTATVESATTEEVLATLQLPGMRKLWDPRFESGHMIARYSRLTYAFYTEMKGTGWLVWPRDIVGAQQNFRSNELNQEIIVIQVSVSEPELGPEVYGKVRATVGVSGWRIKPAGENVDLTYMVKINLGGSIPTSMVQLVATEIPTCVGRVRDTLYQTGHAPFIHPSSSTDNESDIVYQTEKFDASSRVWRATLKPATAGAKFNVVYDKKRMYPDGVKTSAEEDGKDGVAFEDNGEGLVEVTLKEESVGKRVDVVLGPK